MDSSKRVFKMDLGYAVLAVSAFLGGVCSIILICLEVWFLAFLFYVFATTCRLCAGCEMNDFDDAETVNEWNEQYHRKLVIALNFMVGAVLFGRLAWNTFRYHTSVGLFVILFTVVVAYVFAASLTRPNTFAARVRSAALTVALIVIMAHLAFAVQWFYLALGSAMVLGGTWGRLRQLQRRLGWPNM